MGDKTGISWTDATWNPVRGCSRVNEGCRHCYAEQQAARIVRMGKGSPTPYDGLVKVIYRKRPPDDDGVEYDVNEARWTGKVVLDPKTLLLPLRWRGPRRIFVNSMSDLFHESLANEQIAAVFGVMAACPQHTFQILTKRAKRMREWFAWVGGLVGKIAWHMDGVLEQSGIPRVERARIDALLGYGPRAAAWPLANVCLGVSVENQAAADERVPDLLATPAAVRFLGCEPLLGPVDPRCVQHEREFEVDALTGDHGVIRPLRGRGPGIDWIIAGCESGPGARPCDVAWLRSLRDQCAATCVPFFLKQAVGRTGGHEPAYEDDWARDCRLYGITAGPGSKRKAGGIIELPYLDGVQHAAMPG